MPSVGKDSKNRKHASLRAWLKIGVPVCLFTIFGTLTVANLGDQQKDIDYVFGSVAPVSTEEFRLTLENLMGPTFTEGNRITAYQNGDEIFPAMLGAIRSARETICFESYIFLSGEIGDRFAEALSERARAGVKVRLLVDAVGSGSIKSETLDRLKAAGVAFERYHPLAWYTITRINNRTHRKILVVDGRVGFTGGVGISDEWKGHAQDKNHWRDTFYRAEGPVVGQLQSAFVDDWLAVSADIPHGSLYFPKVPAAGASRAQGFRSEPREGAASSLLMYLFSLWSARKEILIANAYFIPGKLATDAMVAARKRGVTVKVIVPGPIMDAKPAQRASREAWGPLLEAGVEIYQYQPTMYHVKAMIVDRTLLSVGSTNFDDRSFRLNSEANLNVLDAAVAEKQALVFEDDLRHSRRVSLEEWQARPLQEKMLDFAASLLRTQL